MHSWRVLILPFLNESALYRRYDFSAPWDGPHNIKLLGEMPAVFACPSRLPPPKGMTSYTVITGPGTMFPGGASVKFADVTDGRSETLMVAETTTADIPWMAPADLDFRTMSLRINERDRPGLSSEHTFPGGAQVVCGDGHILFVSDIANARLLRYLITISGGERDRELYGVDSQSH
jgi:hypothetical protein